MKIYDMHRFEMEWTICEECGKKFLVRKDKLKRGYGKYCSIVCSNRSRCKNRRVTMIDGKPYLVED